MSLDPLIPITEQCLSREWERGVRITDSKLLKDGARCRVYRCRLESGGSGAGEIPHSVIVKTMKPGPEAGRGYTDWASLRFLSGVTAARGIAPAFYAGDANKGIYCIEDFGGDASLERILTEREGGTARRTFDRLAEITVRMNRATRGREDDYLRLRGTLPEQDSADRHREVEV